MVKQNYSYIVNDNIRVEDEMADYLANQMAKDIDFNILAELLVEDGWIKVILSPMTTETSNAIDMWILKQCKGHHHARGLVWLFERSEDAMWFKIRWMGSD
jgi:hypothetical protein